MCGCVGVVEVCRSTDCEGMAQAMLSSRDAIDLFVLMFVMLRICVRESLLSTTAEASKKYMILLLQRNR